MISMNDAQNIFLGLAALGAAGWAAWERLQKARIQKASTDAGVAISSAQEQMFQLMTTRLQAIENDYSRLRDELTEERKHSRMLDIRVQQYQIHMLKLESIMRSAGMEPPAMEQMHYV